MPKIVDLTGKRFGRAIAIKVSRTSKKGHKIWECKCNCGTIFETRGYNLTKGVTKSCGCLCRDTRGDQRRLPEEERAKRYHLRSLKKRSQVDKIVLSLTDEQIIEIKQQNCYYCRVPPGQITRIKNKEVNYFVNGIDRYDNDLGYTIENSVPCCWRCNYAKGPMHGRDFITMCNEVTGTGIKPLDKPNVSVYL